MTMKIASIALLILCTLTAQSVHSMPSPATGSFTERDTNEDFGDDDIKVANNGESEMRIMDEALGKSSHGTVEQRRRCTPEYSYSRGREANKCKTDADCCITNGHQLKCRNFFEDKVCYGYFEG